MDLSTDDVLHISEGNDLEVKAALGRDGRGQLPRSFWETYSAMANSDGGVVLLGIEEKGGGFSVHGLKDVAKVQKAIWDGANDKGQVSVNLFRSSMIEVVPVDGKPVLKVAVPRARRNQRPVYVGSNPLTGTFQRHYEGDYRCDEETVRRMLAEQVEDERDSKLLPGFALKDLDPATVSAYRNAVKAAKPALLWHEQDDEGFLSALGAYRRDRETGAEGLTLGGLLMLGRLPAIQEAVPHYMLDYQERPAPGNERRWTDRLTTDGEWSGNLFEFFRIVLKKLYTDLPVPFRLEGPNRIDVTPVHEALREALVNSLIHADFTGRVSILVVKRPDLFGFRNPGTMRISLEEAMAGGVSDCRNRVLQRMFRLAGHAEQAGHGIPRIYAGWAEQHWRAPILQERRDAHEQTLLTMPMISLLSSDTVARLEERFGSRFRTLPMTQRMALATAAAEGRVSHGRLKSMVSDHPRDITSALSSLCREGFLESAGAARGKYYFFPGEPPGSGREADLLFESSGEPAGGSVHLAGSSEHMAGSSEHLAGSSVHLAGSSEHLGPGSSVQMGGNPEHWTMLLELAHPVRSRRKTSRNEVETTILKLCGERDLTLKELQELLGRRAESLRVHYLNSLARRGLIRLRFPESVSHPYQGYRTVPPE